MIDFDTVQTALIDDWLKTVLVGVEPIQAAMLGGRAAFSFIKPGTKAIALLDLVSVRQLGGDEVRRVVNINQEYDVSVGGMRALTMSVRIDSFSQDPANTAESLLEQARARLRLPVVREALQAAGIGVSSAGPTIRLPFPADDRICSRAAFDLVLSVASNLTDDTGIAAQTIGTVEIASDEVAGGALTGLRDVDGQPTQSQVSVTVTE